MTRYVYCDRCDSIVSNPLPCMKLVIGCETKLVCPFCEHHVDKNLIANSPSKARDALKEKYK